VPFTLVYTGKCRTRELKNTDNTN